MAHVSRRRFLVGGLAGTAVAGLGGAVAAGCSEPRSRTSDPDARATTGGPESAPANLRYLPFRGAHQRGIALPPAEQGLLAAFTITADDRDELRDTLWALSTESERIMSGERYGERDPAYPPLHTGTVGNPAPAADLSVVVSVGASLFDDRYGLADRKPRALERMPFLANDRLDPERSHGDVLLTLSSAHEDVNLFALRQLTRATRGTMALHWMLDGYTRRTRGGPR